MIIDPGAASALTGTESLRKYYEQVLVPRGYAPISTRPGNATFTGIDGKPEPGLCIADVPLSFIGAPDVTWSTDLLGGPGSSCPPLLGNDSLRHFMASIFENVLPNGDGVLVLLVGDPIKSQSEQALFLRILLTDSGHYLLPADGPPAPKDGACRKAR